MLVALIPPVASEALRVECGSGVVPLGAGAVFATDAQKLSVIRLSFLLCATGEAGRMVLFSTHSCSRDFILRSAHHESSRFERGGAVALRTCVLVLAAYVVARKIFPFELLGLRLGEMTLAELLGGLVRALAAAAAAAYLLASIARLPALRERTRWWCERWIAMALGVMTLLMGAVSVILLERKGVAIVAGAHWIARGILWLLV